jgi:probable HAF family extracellular repeat protein
MRKSVWLSVRLGSLLCIGALGYGSRAHADPLYTIVDLGLRYTSPAAPASLATPRLTTDAGAVTTVPVWGQPPPPGYPMANEPLGSDAEFVPPSGDVIHIGLPSSGWNAASALNDLGQAVGESSQPSELAHAFLFTNGQTFDLNHLILGQSTWTITNALNIDDQGRILAYAINGGGEQHTVMLVPRAAPEPSSLAIGILMLCAVGRIVTRRQRSESPSPLR